MVLRLEALVANIFNGGRLFGPVKERFTFHRAESVIECRLRQHLTVLLVVLTGQVVFEHRRVGRPVFKVSLDRFEA